jgi:hypothetical protein
MPSNGSKTIGSSALSVATAHTATDSTRHIRTTHRLSRSFWETQTPRSQSYPRSTTMRLPIRTDLSYPISRGPFRFSKITHHLCGFALRFFCIDSFQNRRTSASSVESFAEVKPFVLGFQKHVTNPLRVNMLDHIILRIYELNVKVTVELSDAELREILRVTREKRKGAAIRQLALEALMLKKRRELLDEVEAGKWSVDLPPIERLREDRKL